MQDDLTLEAYHYHLPEANIAQIPADRRDMSRLLVYSRSTEKIRHLQFKDISSLIDSGDLLVLNNTKVFPARLIGKKETGGKTEVFLLNYPKPLHAGDEEQKGRFAADALVKSSRPPHPGTKIFINDTCICTLIEKIGRGTWRTELCLSPGTELETALKVMGDIPLPPYINRTQKGTTDEDAERYQTVYASETGAVAAPTAGLHFTEALLDSLNESGVQHVPVTLHVGYGTFSPVESSDITEHNIHSEYMELTRQSADIINRVKQAGGRIWAIGTTTVRSLEFAARKDGTVAPYAGRCDLYITPGFRFRVVDNLITNFHLPKSSLMFLVAALCGRRQLLNCYEEAISHGYRFYSYGDAMAVID